MACDAISTLEHRITSCDISGPEEPSRLLLLKVGTWSAQTHDEIWVYYDGFWQKDHGLWLEIQKGSWEEVILNQDFKKALQKDVYGFFTSEKVYKNLGIPWKVMGKPSASE
ncbi:hypothetical protein C0992_004436 [Termitomyces sp. T32_za158]|nr:hypothetical protein C0992_004436 [Termitomyces sp. T32_za158]